MECLKFYLKVLRSLWVHLNYMNKDKGQILAEVVVAIGVIMMVLIGMSSLMSKSTKTIRQNDVKDEAVKLVEAQIRYYKDQRDRDINGFFANIAALPKDVYGPCAWFAPTPSPVINDIRCEVMYSNITGGNGIGVRVKAVWTEEFADDRDVALSASIMQF